MLSYLNFFIQWPEPEKDTKEEMTEEDKRMAKFWKQIRKAKGPIEYKNGLPFLPRFYLNFCKPNYFDIPRLMLMTNSHFDEYIRYIPQEYKEELKCMKEEIYYTRPSKRGAVILTFIQRNEELGRELGLLS